jgi:hypothetical protein
MFDYNRYWSRLGSKDKKIVLVTTFGTLCSPEISVVDPDPDAHQIERYDPDPHQSIKLDPVPGSASRLLMTSQNVWKYEPI